MKHVEQVPSEVVRLIESVKRWKHSTILSPSLHGTLEREMFEACERLEQWEVGNGRVGGEGDRTHDG